MDYRIFKYLIVSLVLMGGMPFVMISCGYSPNVTDNAVVVSKRENIIDQFKLDTMKIDENNEKGSPFEQELSRALSNPTIDDYYKELYRNERLILAEDNKMLSITDSLFTTDLDKDLFYFIVFTKSMNGSDGFYSEALGLASYNFVTKKTECFANYFNIAPKLADIDMENWASFVFAEVQISNEKKELIAIKNLEYKLLQNIKGSRKEYELVIDRFMNKLKRMAKEINK